jgi:hypothetical protein
MPYRRSFRLGTAVILVGAAVLLACQVSNAGWLQ